MTPSPSSPARDGLRALGQVPLLEALAAGLLAALCAGATSALLVLLARDRLGGADSFGTSIAAVGAGAAAGPLLLLHRIEDLRRPWFVFGPCAVRGVVDLVLAVVTGVPLALRRCCCTGCRRAPAASPPPARCSPAFRTSSEDAPWPAPT